MRFIPNYACIAVPLNELLKKYSSNKIDWKPYQVDSFNTLKKTLLTNPILCLPDKTKTYFHRTDARDNGIGAVLVREVKR